MVVVLNALQPDLKAQLAKEQIHFGFIPPNAPHFGTSGDQRCPVGGCTQDCSDRDKGDPEFQASRICVIQHYRSRPDHTQLPVEWAARCIATPCVVSRIRDTQLTEVKAHSEKGRQLLEALHQVLPPWSLHTSEMDLRDCRSLNWCHSNDHGPTATQHTVAS